ncbi:MULTISPECIES: NADPH-dependent FMN reductase [Streptomyces]|uniref:NAD(P)H-dependent FMN reductase n=1 Tax=Streptomyces hyderabadensis TaxID=598549 RepID=A0ABP9IR26_9ACTN|nr:NADPH-dependent FMN reductase [Streptomyces hyderabadensis]
MAQSKQATILALSGSLRAQSYNTGLVRAAVKHNSGGAAIEVYEDLALLPMYNQDHDNATPPQEVVEWRSRVAAADGLFIVTPEHNASVPAALKNALDWASTEPAGGILVGKHVAVAGASPGAFGSARAQLALRQILASIGADVLAKPDVSVFHCHERFDAEGNLTDTFAISLIGELVDALSARIARS